MRWRGELPGEGGTVNDILISYSSFDTTHESDAQGPAATLNITPVVCKDNKGNVVLTSNVAGGDRLVRGVIALKNDPAFRAPFFILELNNAGTCRIDGPALCRSVLAICEQMSLKVIAEGIETVSQAHALRQMRCHLGQGYLYGSPLRLDQLATHRHRVRDR